MLRPFTETRLRAAYFATLVACLVVGLGLIRASYLHDKGNQFQATTEQKLGPVSVDSPRTHPAQDSATASEADGAIAPPVMAAPASRTDQNVSTGQGTGTDGSISSEGGAAHSPTSEKAAAITVGLTVNDTFKGNVSVPPGSNQCDVLTQALASGIIASLDMRYYAQYKTQGVFKIDGQGDSGAVWWAYKVNGKSPPYGCSYVQAKEGDSVKWEYVRS